MGAAKKWTTKASTMPLRRKRRIKITRDMVLFVGGFVGVLHETLLSHTERPSLLVVFAGMMGLPVFLRRDEKGNNDEHDADRGP